MANTLQNVNLVGGSGSSDLANATGVLTIAHGGTNSSTALNNNRVMQSASGKIQEAAAITANRAVISDSNGIPTHSSVTNTELGYVSGVTSAIQTQLASAGLVGSTSKNSRLTLPSGWAWANGQAVSRTTYSTLFSAIGTQFGTGDGSSTFNLPAIYNDPSPHQSSHEMPAIRSYAPLLPLQDGRFVWIAGHDGTNEQTAVYIGTIIAGGDISWVTCATAFPQSTYLHSASVLSDGRILVCGGVHTSAVNNTYFGTVSGNDISWAAGTNLTAVRFGQSQTTLSDGRIMLLGGNAGAGAITTTQFGTISSNTITWASGTALPGATTLHTAILMPNGLVVMIGGNNGADIATVRILSISSNTITYTTGENILVAISEAASVCLNDGRIYVLGGGNGGTAQTATYIGIPIPNDAGNYNFTWNAGPPLPQVRKRLGAAINPAGQIMYAGGAITNNTNQKTAVVSRDNSEIIRLS